MFVYQVGTGQVAAAWIGMRMIGIANGQYLYVQVVGIQFDFHLQFFVC